MSWISVIKSWCRQHVSAIIVSAISAALAAILVTGILATGHSFVGAVADLPGHFSEDALVPVGALWLLSAGCAALCVIIAVWCIRKALPPRHLKYTEDLIYEVRWRWEYDEDGKPHEFLAFCPECDSELARSEPGPELWLTCERCRTTFHKLKGEKGAAISVWHQLARRVRRAVERKIRTKEWRRAAPPPTKGSGRKAEEVT